MVEVKKKEKESSESLIRRFSKRVQQSGVILRARNVQFREKKKNKRKIKEDAIRRHQIRQKKEYLRKTGQLEDYQTTNKRY